MVYSKFDKKANEILTEFVPAIPIVVSAGGIATMVTGLAAGLVAVLGTAGIIAQQHQKSEITSKDQLFKQPTEIQPSPPQQQPITPPEAKPGKIEPGTATPELRPSQPQLRPGETPQVSATTRVIPTPPTPSAQATSSAAIAPEPPKTGATASQQQQQAGTPSAVTVPPVKSYRYPYTKADTIEAYPIDRQLGNINVPGTRTAYRDTFNMPAMQAFKTGIEQPPLQQMVPQGDIPNAPKSLRAKYQHRAFNPDEYEGTKAFGGIANLFK